MFGFDRTNKCSTRLNCGWSSSIWTDTNGVIYVVQFATISFSLHRGITQILRITFTLIWYDTLYFIDVWFSSLRRDPIWFRLVQFDITGYDTYHVMLICFFPSFTLYITRFQSIQLECTRYDLIRFDRKQCSFLP